MRGSIENCLSSILIIVTFALSVCRCQDQDQGCTITARPHRQGICGEKLAQAHANLCFLLSIAYPGVFNKRSSISSSFMSLPPSFISEQGHRRVTDKGHYKVRRMADNELLERIYSIPMSVLAEHSLNEDNWRSFVYKRGIENMISQEKKPDAIQYKDLQELPASPTRMLIQILSKRSLPSVRKRNVGLVCECCINSCLPRQMATYC